MPILRLFDVPTPLSSLSSFFAEDGAPTPMGLTRSLTVEQLTDLGLTLPPMYQGGRPKVSGGLLRGFRTVVTIALFSMIIFGGEERLVKPK